MPSLNASSQNSPVLLKLHGLLFTPQEYEREDIDEALLSGLSDADALAIARLAARRLDMEEGAMMWQGERGLHGLFTELEPVNAQHRLQGRTDGLTRHVAVRPGGELVVMQTDERENVPVISARLVELPELLVSQVREHYLIGDELSTPQRIAQAALVGAWTMGVAAELHRDDVAAREPRTAAYDAAREKARFSSKALGIEAELIALASDADAKSIILQRLPVSMEAEAAAAAFLEDGVPVKTEAIHRGERVVLRSRAGAIPRPEGVRVGVAVPRDVHMRRDDLNQDTRCSVYALRDGTMVLAISDLAGEGEGYRTRLEAVRPETAAHYDITVASTHGTSGGAPVLPFWPGLALQSLRGARDDIRMRHEREREWHESVSAGLARVDYPALAPAQHWGSASLSLTSPAASSSSGVVPVAPHASRAGVRRQGGVV